MSTIRYLLDLELKRPVLWLLGLGAAVGVYGLSLPGGWGVASMLVAVATMSLFPVALLKSTPWCSDTAFWRTRPISRRQLFAVKSLALVLLGLLPLLLVTWVASGDLDRATRWVLRSFALGWAGALLLAVASSVAIGSRKQKYHAFTWQAVFTVPLISVALIAILRNWFRIPMPDGPGQVVSGILIGAVIVMVMSVVAWLVVGLKGRALKAMMVLFFGGLIWPWVVTTNRTDFFAEDEIESRPVEMTRGESLLRMAVGFDGLEEDEFFVPRDIWWNREHRVSLREAGVTHMVGKEEHLTPLTNQHADFVSVMDSNKLWHELRSRVPAHDAWVPSENPEAGRRTDYRLPQPGTISGGLKMWGKVFAIEELSSFAAQEAGTKVLREGLEFLGSSVPNDHAIDVRLRLTLPVLSREHSQRRLESVNPPELWGILHHGESGTAYGAVSIRAGRRPDGIHGLLLWRQDLMLRFELPRLESALLGLDPEKVLAESELHLFEMTEAGWASVALDEEL